ncbi:MAG: rhodanese-like domain-containing protein [Pseudomonadota bacterium]|nr:rhodanese-like domain-containing protein [Pseudomonadota bacterium]
MKKWLSIFITFNVFSYGFVTSSYAEDENPAAIEAMQDYFDFAQYSGGTIFKEQLEKLEPETIAYIDARNAQQYESGHIANAINIEWRELLSRKDEVPTDKTVVLYCDTGLLSSKAHFALSVAGFENVRVLFGGYLKWKEK